MSIDTLLEAARYLEWQAQQQQITREECKQKELIVREAESRRSEVVTLSVQTGGANNNHHYHHLAWGNDPRHLQSFHVPVVAPPAPAPPPPSLPPTQVPVTIIPVVPVVAPMPSPPATHPAMPAAAAVVVATPMLNGSSPPHHFKQEQQHPLPPLPHPPPPPQTGPVPRPLLSSPPVKAEPGPQQNGAGDGVQSQPPVSQVTYQQPPCVSPHTLLPKQQHSPEPRTNGLLAADDMRGADGKRRPGGAGTREVHNKLEKNRRAHLKECFETLKKSVPNVDEKKTSNLSVLRGALRYIQTLKRKEKDERLAREKIATQQRLAELRAELSLSLDAGQLERVLRQAAAPEDDQVSTSTASEGEEDLDQDILDEDVSAPSPAKPLPKAPPPIIQAHPLLALQHAALPLSGVLTTPSNTAGGLAVQSNAPPPQAIAPAPQAIALHPLRPSAVQVQPTVIAHAAVSHPSVIQAVHHAPLPANHKHLAHIAPSPGPASTMLQPMAAAPGRRGTAEATAGGLAHRTHHGSPARLPTLYPQAMSVAQPTVVGHITHTFTHHHHHPHHHHALATANGVQVNGAAVVGPATLGKPAVLAPHPQLVGPAAVLNPVTLVNVPVGTLKLA
ncbi:LOW QUALITY PROTEIN: hypothetical protein CRUP_015460 [Coryphaenoides rupestris]|nr:LOW QUALITY PROTEIN: hypothetical protein CRUP_015460 [Coryphaenoides rupestris]